MLLEIIERNKVRNRVEQVGCTINELINRQAKMLQYIKHHRKPYGCDIHLLLPYGVTSQMFDKHAMKFKEAFNLRSLHMEYRNRIAIMKCVTEYNFEDFRAVRTKPYEVLLGVELEKPLKVNMNDYPHILIGGSVGSGKSRLELGLISNLIINSSDFIDIYLMQVKKSDIAVFEDCDCVKCYATSLEAVRDNLLKINQIIKDREKIIDTKKGYYSILEYNQKHKDKMKYVYCFIDEFSFLLPTKNVDTKEEIQLKQECLKIIKTIAVSARFAGVFLCCTLQKPTSTSIPTDIKDMLNTRIALKLNDLSGSRVILNNDNALYLDTREFILRTLGEVKGYTMTINHDIINKFLKPFKGHKPMPKAKNVQVSKKEKAINLLNYIEGR